MKGLFRNRARLLVPAACLLALFASAMANSSALWRDDDGNHHRPLPAGSRVIALGPNLVEVLFEVGAGSQLVGVSDYADFPPAARALTRVAAHNSVNYELISSLEPDLIVVWKTGFGEIAIEKLRRLGFNVFVSEPEVLDDIATLMESLGSILGRVEEGRVAASGFRDRVRNLEDTYREKEALSVFYQVWDEPMQTLNGDHVVSAVLELCGGENVFASLPMKAPRVGIEAVLAANPDVIMASGPNGVRPVWLDDWRRWSELAAVKHEQLVFVDPDILVRHSPRILDGATEVCAILDRARIQKNAAVAGDG